MKPEHRSPPILPQKPLQEPPAPLIPFYPSSPPQYLYGNSILPSSQFLQVWTVFTTLESVPTQKILMCHKTTPCPDSPCPRGKLCPYFHSFADRRRQPFYNGRLTYVHTMCPYLAQGLACAKGDQCQYSHSNEESLYHPAKYKTAMCLQGPMCLRELCPWAHFQEELRNTALIQHYQGESFYAVQPEVPLVSYAGAAYPALDAELSTFKTQPCTYQVQHNHKHCIYYHSSKDRRRVPGNYSAERCEASENDGCPLGDSCPKSHSMVERLYHPDKYKTKYCNNYPDRLHECEYGSYCCFAHSDQELKVELIHYLEMDEDFYLFYFKTGWCPFNHEHNKAACVYAHNWQDFRRKPHLFRYTNQLCPNWQSETFISEYKEGCIYEHNCGYCHGWKEQLYHPLTYKTLPCPDVKKCQKGMDCPYYHSEYDRRNPNKFAVFYPRPRNYRRNPNLTITNNVNLQREYELQQMSITQMQASVPLSFVAPHPASRMPRRFSEEVQYKSSLSHTSCETSATSSSIKHRGSYDLTPKGDKRAPPKSSAPLVHIREESPESFKEDNIVQPREESPESPKEDYLFEIFQPHEDSKTNTSLFFSPKIKKAFNMTKEAYSGENLINLKENIATGHRSCPVTPLPKRKSFGRSPVFEKLHLDDPDPSLNEHTAKEMKRVEKFLDSVGLDHLYPRFSEKGLTMNDIFLMSQEEFKELGIEKDEEIKRVMDKARENLERSFDEEMQTPGKESDNKNVERDDTIGDTDDLEKEGMKIFSYLEK